MKKWCTFISVLLLTMSLFPSVPSENQLPTELDIQFLDALTRGDDESLYALVRAYRYKTYALVIKFLDEGLLSELNGEIENFRHRMKQAERLAEIYNDIFDMDNPLERVQLYQRWSKAQKMNKAKADLLKYLGMQAYERTDFEDALNHWSESLDIYREIGDRRSEGCVLYKMGVVHSRRGQRREATRCSEQALRIDKEVDNRIGEAHLYTTPFFYSRIGQYEMAINLYEQALSVVREIGDRNQERRTLSFIAWNYHLLRQYEKALEYLKQALGIAREIEHRRGEAISLSDMALMYANIEQYERAIDCYELAFYINKETGHEFGILDDLIGLGNVYNTLGQFSKALTYFQDGLDLAQNIRSLDFIWKAQWCIGTVLEKLHEDDEALEYYRQSIRTIESIRNQLEVDALKTYFFIEEPPVYNSIIALLTEKGRYVEAYEYAERSKALTLLEMIAGRSLESSTMIPPDLLSAKEEIEEKMQRFNSRLAGTHGDTIDKGTLRDSLQMVRIEHQELLRQIELNHPSHLKSPPNWNSVTLDDVQRNVLGTEDAPIVIEYCVDRECTHVWVVDSDSLYYRKINIGEEQLERIIKNLLEPFHHLESGTSDRLGLSYDLGSSYQLYLKIFQPVEEYFAEDATLIIVPDEILYTLPFEALVTRIDPTEPNTELFFSRYENARYLIEKYNISYAQSARILGLIGRKSSDKSERKDQLLAFGNPIFQTKNLKWIFEPLPETDLEVKTISSIFGHLECNVFSGQDAHEGVFKEKVRSSRYIHLATHSILEDEDPFYSRIVFALDEDPKEDGFLETYEIFDLTLNAELVVLSSCKSGLGKLSKGEGFIGLTRAFLCAGASSVVASLWSVGDPTTRMMKLFYQNLQTGRGKSEALRQAKIEMIHTRDENMSYAHPFLWAPFVLVGEWN